MLKEKDKESWDYQMDEEYKIKIYNGKEIAFSKNQQTVLRGYESELTSSNGKEISIISFTHSFALTIEDFEIFLKKLEENLNKIEVNKKYFILDFCELERNLKGSEELIQKFVKKNNLRSINELVLETSSFNIKRFLIKFNDLELKEKNLIYNKIKNILKNFEKNNKTFVFKPNQYTKNRTKIVFVMGGIIYKYILTNEKEVNELNLFKKGKLYKKVDIENLEKNIEMNLNTIKLESLFSDETYHLDEFLNEFTNNNKLKEDLKRQIKNNNKNNEIEEFFSTKKFFHELKKSKSSLRFSGNLINYQSFITLKILNKFYFILLEKIDKENTKKAEIKTFDTLESLQEYHKKINYDLFLEKEEKIKEEMRQTFI